MDYLFKGEGASESTRGISRREESNSSTPAFMRPALLIRLLLLAGAGGATTLGYTAIILCAVGSELGWTTGAAATAVGVALGGACGLLLGTRR